MNPIYLNPPPSPFPLVEPNEDQHLHFFCPPSEASSASQSSSIFFNPTQEQGGTNDREQQEAYKCVLHGGSSDHQVPTSPSLPTAENDINNGLIFSICKREDGDEDQSNSGSVKWMPSNMRFIRKMVNSDRMGADKPVKSLQKFEDHQQPPSPFDTGNSSNNSSNNSNNTVRVCADCNTTKTPLWRSGPRGPKSLCNACGIRQRKARRAMAAAAAAASGAVLATETSSMRKKVHHKEKRSDSGYVQQYKKRCKLVTPRSRKKLCFEDFTIKLSKNSAFHRVFPQDEKEAAILLMALSCGLVRG